jgi:hypothetical protein
MRAGPAAPTKQSSECSPAANTHAVLEITGPSPRPVAARGGYIGLLCTGKRPTPSGRAIARSASQAFIHIAAANGRSAHWWLARMLWSIRRRCPNCLGCALCHSRPQGTGCRAGNRSLPWARGRIKLPSLRNRCFTEKAQTIPARSLTGHQAVQRKNNVSLERPSPAHTFAGVLIAGAVLDQHLSLS